MSESTPEANYESEAELDALLEKVEQRKATKVGAPAEQPKAIDVFRARMEEIYIPAFAELSEKYAEKGIDAELDADEFLGGGTGIKMRFTYGDLSLELDGTVMRGGVAFYVIRWIGGMAGAVVSGPLMRIRNLSADDFRQFVVEHIRSLIKDALRRA
jgi:hypothetical protein